MKVLIIGGNQSSWSLRKELSAFAIRRHGDDSTTVQLDLDLWGEIRSGLGRSQNVAADPSSDLVIGQLNARYLGRSRSRP